MIRHYRSDFGALACPVACLIRGPLDVPALAAAIDTVAGRHEALRTSFAGRGRGLTQLVHPPRPVELARADLDSPDDPESALRAALAHELRTPIDPEVWPVRATLWRASDTYHLVCLNIHHLVTDAWSTGILFRDLCAAYAGSALPPPGWQYAQFVQWQQRFLASPAVDRHRAYWRRQLAGAQLPRLGQAAAGQPGGTGVLHADLDADAVVAVRELAQRHRTTLFTVLLAAFYAHLHRVTGQPDLAVASMFANRSQPELRETVGLLANMVLLRARLPDAATFAELVAQTHATVIGAFAYQELPYQMLPRDLLATDGVRADDLLFQVMAELEHARVVGQTTFELLVPEDIGSRFKVELAIAQVHGRLRAVLFHTSELDRPAAEEFLHGYTQLVAALAGRPATPLPAVRRLP